MKELAKQCAPIAEAIAKNCKVAPQLVLAPLMWGVEDLLKKQSDALERLTAENTQLQKDYTCIKESSTLWHDRYKTKCQEYIDRQAILGAEIVALEAERDSVVWGVDWGKLGDRTSITIVKRRQDGTIEVVATEGEPK